MYFGGKMLQRQYVPATKRHITKISGRQNIDTKKFMTCVKKISSSHSKENIIEIKFILTTIISIEQCLYKNLSGGTNRFLIVDSPVLNKFYPGTIV